MDTFKTLSQVKTNLYLKDLEQVADEYGVYSRFREIHDNPDINLNGVYFIYGTDEHTVMGDDTDIRSKFNEGFRDKFFFHRDCIIQKLTNQADLATHSEILGNLRHCEFIHRLEDEFNIQLPGKITVRNLVNLRNSYCAMQNEQITPMARASYREAVKLMMQQELKYHNPSTKEYKNLQYLSRGYYDSSQGRFYNWMRKHFILHKNRVNLAQLSNECLKSTQKYIVNVTYIRAIRKELNKHPEILYNMSKPFGNKEHDDTNMIYGSQKHDMRVVRVTYDSAYSREMDCVMNKVFYPEAMQTNVESLLKKNGKCTTVGISPDDYHNFVSLCEANHIDFCIDSLYTTEYGNALNMVVSTTDSEMLHNICCRLSKEVEELHIGDSSHPIVRKVESPSKVESLSYSQPESDVSKYKDNESLQEKLDSLPETTYNNSDATLDTFLLK